MERPIGAAIVRHIEGMQGSIRGLLGAPVSPMTLEDSCRNAQGALNDAIDLVLIHNEGPTGGSAPRGVLNPLTVFLAVAAWERLIYDFAVVSGVPVRPTETVGRLAAGTDPGKKTRKVLDTITGGVLPDALHITDYWRTVGKTLHQPTPLGGSSATLGEVVDAVEDCVLLRNGIAHHVLPDRMRTTEIRSDAGKSRAQDDQGLTINAGLARSVLAVYVQLVDQAMCAALKHAGHSRTDLEELLLPEWWFTDRAVSQGKHRRLTEGCLWGGVELPRPWL